MYIIGPNSEIAHFAKSMKILTHENIYVYSMNFPRFYIARDFTPQAPTPPPPPPPHLNQWEI